MHNSTRKSKGELRKFGFVMTGALVLLSAWLWYKNAGYQYTLGVAMFFLLSGLLVPTILRPIEFVWMKLALVLGAIMTRVILTLTFVLAVTPLGILMRLTGKDPLSLKDRDRSSYWIETDRAGTAARHDKPF